MKKLLIISGPTASGKTSYSIKIAKKLISDLKKEIRIINFDSLLFYRELSIGTAKPTLEEMSGIPHSLINISSIKSPLNAHDYVELAENEIKSAHNKGELPILVGGSAFYLRALLKGMYESSSASEELKEEVKELFDEKGIEPFIEFLNEKDPETMRVLHENDHYRIIRAYEHIRETGGLFSVERKKMEQKDPYDLANGIHPEWEVHHIYLDIPKEEHWSYITGRTTNMIDAGLVEEVKSLLDNGMTGKEKPLKSIGYIETLSWINNEFATEDEYKERISISTRQLAKSQRTFFKKIHPKFSYNPLTDEEKIISDSLIFARV